MLVIVVCSAALQPAHAAYECTDEWGYRYRAAQPVVSQVTRLTCVAIAGAPDERQRDARLALGLARRDASADPHTDSPADPANVPPPRRMPHRPPDPARWLPQQLDALIHASAREFSHEPSLLKAIIDVESGFNPRAVSPKGARGLMQIMPATGKRFGVNQPERDLFEPSVNIRAGAQYLRFLRDLFADRMELVVAAYNAGEGAVMKYGQRIPPYAETQDYVRKVMARYRQYHGQSHGQTRAN
jgi:soluble lytic murein transglycosylase-like protein